MISSTLILLSIGYTLNIAHSASTLQIIDAESLHSRLGEVSVIDTREEGFEAAHIPGSQSVDWKDWTLKKPNLINYVLGNAKDWGKVPLPGMKLQKRLESLGLSNEKEIVVIGKPSGWGEEGRFAWQFLYWGAKKVSLLDGGIDSWTAKHYAIEKGKSTLVSKGNFKLEIDTQRRATTADVELALKRSSRPLLDARSPEEFLGKRETAQKRGGHIPGARSLPVALLYEADGKFIAADKLKKLAAIDGPSPITYCVGGVRSALLAVLIEARLGIIAANYDASMWEWSDDPSRPLMSTPAGK
ncbi:MAG: sulfurtransferase [Bdellovibrionales bacterium]|nr:sulfurtransferase [Oligoflexia bacterium]